jgi:hypothetical protein
MKSFLAALTTAGVLAAGLALAKGPADYSTQWPVVADGDGAYAITLTPEVYAHIRRADLGDLAAFAADGTPLAFGPLPPALERPAPRWRDARWFALPTQAGAAGGDLHLHLTRNTAGELTLDANLAGTAANEPKPDLLIDVQPGKEAIDELDLTLGAGSGTVNAQMTVEASDDLQAWHVLLPSATVARLEQGGEVLERSIIELPATNAAFLRLRPLDGTTALPLSGVRVRLQPAAPSLRIPAEQWLPATFVRREGRSFFYALPARIPAQRLDIALGDDNVVDRFVVSSRDGPGQGREDYWASRGELTAFRLRGGGVSLDNAPMDLSLTRDREWRLDANTDLAQAPTLRFGYHPETWLLLTHGPAPYVIAAGSGRARRGDFPLDALYGQVQARYGADWQPPAAALGAMATAGGEAALVSTPPDRNRTWLLWGVLLVGALGIVAMVVKLMRDAPAADQA